MAKRKLDAVKHDKEVSLNYMKTVEWEEMLIKQGRKEEQVNTERERLRADREAERADSASKRAESEAARADRAEKELMLLKKRLASIESKT